MADEYAPDECLRDARVAYEAAQGREHDMDSVRFYLDSIALSCMAVADVLVRAEGSK